MKAEIKKFFKWPFGHKKDNNYKMNATLPLFVAGVMIGEVFENHSIPSHINWDQSHTPESYSMQMEETRPVVLTSNIVATNTKTNF